MYAHQVIEDLKIREITTGIKDTFFDEAICKSMQYHIENAEDIIDLTEKQLAYKKIFNNEYSNLIKSPYEFIWVDWGKCKIYPYEEVSGVGCVVINDRENNISISPYFRHSFGNIWIPSIKTYVFKVGQQNNFVSLIDTKLEKFMETRNEIKELEGFKLFSDELCTGASFMIEAFLLLLNCKNISTEKKHPPEALNKKRIKQGKQPLFTYHTLVVNPMSEKKRSDGPHEPTGIKQRLHFCRGHFKEYTESNKLFGKHTGLYWWQPMVRGNKELGLVHKDYEVRAA